MLDHPRAWRTYRGGRRLDEWHGKHGAQAGNYPEEWVCSTVVARNPGRPEEGLSHLAECGTALKDLFLQSAAYYLGRKHTALFGAQPGVLLKLIDTEERLTVQVHPDRPTAQRLFCSPFGKTECWHILDDTPVNGVCPSVYLGFRPGIDPKKWKQLFVRQDIEGMLAALHKIEVHAGETILVPGGVPHAIGAHCFLAEIQEPTDYTIRVERTTPAGLAISDEQCHQGLGFTAMFDCFHYEGVTLQEARRRWFLPSHNLWMGPGGRADRLVGYESIPYFSLERLTVWQELFVPGSDTFSGIVVLEGEGAAQSAFSSCTLRQGDQVFLPAGIGDWKLIAGGAPLKLLRFMGPHTYGRISEQAPSAENGCRIDLGNRVKAGL